MDRCELLRFIDNKIKRWDDHWHIDEDCIVISDTHTPYESHEWLNRMLDVAEAVKLKTLIMDGDGFDFAAFSSWERNEDWDAEREYCARFMWVLYHSFDKIYWLPANHEHRTKRGSNWQVSAQSLIRDVLMCYAMRTNQEFHFIPDKLKFSNYSYTYLGEDYLVYHPHEKGGNPRLNANKIALTQQKHVVVAHHHQVFREFADDGKHLLIGLGHMGDILKFPWKNKDMDSFRKWTNGFGVYRGGHFYQIGQPPYTKIEDIL